MGEGASAGDGDSTMNTGGTGAFTNGTGGGNASGTGSSTGSGSTSGNSGGTGNLGTGGTVQQNCSNVEPPYDPNWPDATCDKWANEADGDPCNQDWFADYCDLSCNRCEASSTGGSNGTGGSSGNTGGSGNSGGGTGQGNPWGGVNGGQNGWASRYWDCCKQSCGWAANSGNNPVVSCGGNGENVVSSNDQSSCSGGSSSTCNSFAPWAYSDEVAFGFAATHAGEGVACGTCYKVQFTGSSHNGGNDPGSQALNGKVMILMATNIGGDVNPDGQLDLLIPGGGTGAFYGCGSAWGVQEGHSDLGAKYGGLRSGCSNGDLAGLKSCVADKCQKLFGSRGLDDMYEGCMWYVNWFQAANNPNFKVETVACPSELSDVAR